jgi:HEAT repeat protein
MLSFSAVHVASEPADPLVDLILGLLADDDIDVRALALEQIRREAPGAAATEQFAAQLATLSPPAQVGLLRALADRGDVVAKPAILQLLAATPPREVQIAAWDAIGWLGDATDCAALTPLLSAENKGLGGSARDSLVRLSGSGVTDALLVEYGKASVADKVTIIEILTARRDLSVKPQLFAWSVVATPAVRQAAMVALSQLATPSDLPQMLPGVLKATRGAERDAAEKGVMLVAQRQPDLNARAEPILRAMAEMTVEDQRLLLPTLGRVGGEAAFREVETAIGSEDAATHSAGIAAISNWPDASVATRLIELTKADDHANHRSMALRALIRIAPLPDGRSDLEKLELLKTAFALCQRDEERNMAIQRGSAIRTPETLRFVLPFVDQAPYAEKACETIVQLAHDRQLRDDNKDEFHQALDKVLATSTNATVLERADRYKKGQTWVRPQSP